MDGLEIGYEIIDETPELDVDLASGVKEIELELLTDAEAIELGLDPLAYKGEDGRSPYLDEEGYWWEYDDETKEYRNTGVKADAGTKEALAAAEEANRAKDAADTAAESALKSAEKGEKRIDDALSEANQKVGEALNSAEERVNEAVSGAAVAAGHACARADDAAQAAQDIRRQSNAVICAAKSQIELVLSAAQAASEAAMRAAEAVRGFVLSVEDAECAQVALCVSPPCPCGPPEEDATEETTEMAEPIQLIEEEEATSMQKEPEATIESKESVELDMASVGPDPELERLELRARVGDELAAKGLPRELADRIDCSDPDGCAEWVNTLDRAVQRAADARLSIRDSPAPKSDIIQRIRAAAGLSN